MLNDWWMAHRLEIYADLVLIGVLLLAVLGVWISKRGRRKT